MVTVSEGGGRQRRLERARSTSRAVTPAVVVAAVGALDRPTAAEVAGAIAVAGGLRISGRAVRFLAEAAGILYEPDATGVRRYWVPEPGAPSPQP